MNRYETKWTVIFLLPLLIGAIVLGVLAICAVKRQGNQPPCKQTPKATEQTCKICGVADGLNFTVADEDWEAIVNPEMQSKVICLKHFDKMAYNARKDYTITELYFAGIKKGLKFIPIPFTPNSKGG